MVARFRAIAVVGVGLAILLTISAAPAAPQANNPYNLRGPNNSPMTTCAREVGMVFNAYNRRWRMAATALATLKSRPTTTALTASPILT